MLNYPCIPGINPLELWCVILLMCYWDFPGSPVVKTSPSNAGGAGLIPGQGAKIPNALWPKTKNKTEAIL